MSLIQQIYILTLVAFITLLLFLGLYMILGRCPEEIKKSSYSWSRKTTGSAFLWLAMEIIAFVVFDIREDDVELSSMLNLVTYYLFALFVSAAFIRLLDEEVTMSKAKVVRELGLWVVYSVSLVVCVLSADVEVSSVVLIVGAILLFMKVFELFLYANKIYKKAVERSLNYHSDNVEPIIRWVSKSTYLFFALCVTSLLAAFAPKLLVVVNILFAACVMCYVFASYINVMVSFTMINGRNGGSDEVGLIPQEETTVGDDGVLKPEVAQMIKAEIDRWIEDKGYVEVGVSIKRLSAKVRTNRTYLSQYINKVYNLPFRDWIVYLRVTYAKQMMLEQAKMTVAQVAQKVGFSSSATFTRSFTRLESMSPAKWREQNMNLSREEGRAPTKL